MFFAAAAPGEWSVRMSQGLQQRGEEEEEEEEEEDAILPGSSTPPPPLSLSGFQGRHQIPALLLTPRNNRLQVGPEKNCGIPRCSPVCDRDRDATIFKTRTGRFGSGSKKRRPERGIRCFNKSRSELNYYVGM